MRPILGRALLFFAILSVPMVSCTALGFVFGAQAANVAGPVSAAALESPAAVPDEAFVEVADVARAVARDELPLGADGVAVDPGAAVLALDGAPTVVAYCAGDACAGLPASPGEARPVRLAGRVCGATGSALGCSVPPTLSAYARAEARRRGRDTVGLRVLLVGETPAGPRASMITAFSIAGALALLWIGLVVASSRRRPAPRLVEERSFALSLSGPGVREALRRLAGTDRLRWESDGPGRIAFAQGLGEMQARIRGIRSSAEVPRRAIVEWEEAPFRGSAVRVRVEEAVHWLPGGGVPFAELCRAALVRTADQVESILRPGGGSAEAADAEGRYAS